jgi:trans-aconitate methyltransferase
MTDQAQAASHWDDAYAQGDDTRSWFEEHPRMSLRMLDSAGVTAADALMDVGGGASRLAAVLLDRGFRDLTVLDISANGMRYAQHHLRGQAGQVNWLTADVLRWHPARRYRVWHDRAVFHFLTTADQRHQYLTTLNTATSPGTVAIFGCFAPDGPQYCSGLPVARYTPAQLANQVGPNWNVTGENQEAHATPAGVIQPFTWVALRRQS